jgi:epoxyqueuosine reductase
LLDDEAAIVRGAAVWALRSLETDSGRLAALAAQRGDEPDAHVRAEWSAPLEVA